MLSLLVFVALIVRRRGGSLREDPNGDELRLFNEGETEPSGLETLESIAADSPVEAASHHTAVDQEPAEPVRPRRGMPTD